VQNETTYIFFNLLLCGLVTSEIYHKVNRSQRTGLALGLILVGLFMVLTFEESKAVLRRQWFRIGAVVALIISLTCTGELVWGEIHFKVLMTALLIIVGLLSAMAQGEIGNLSPVFWFVISVCAVAATFIFGQKYVDWGAYLGAWLWIIFEFISSRLKTTLPE
jgi:hypothetical protein